MAHPLDSLIERSWGVYIGGLVTVLTVRTVLPPGPERALGVSLVVGVMILTYTGERWDDAGRPHVREGVVGVATVGVLVGLWLALTGRVAGLAFLAGGLLFADRGVRGGGAT